MLERERHDITRQPLAIARYRVDRTRRQFAQNRDPLDQFRHLLEVIVEGSFQFGAARQRHHLARFARVEIAKIVQLANVFLAFALDRGLGNRQEFIGRLAHRRDDNDRMPIGAGFHDARDALDSGCRFDGRAAEFHDDHR